MHQAPSDPEGALDRQQRRAWGKRVAEWLHDTSHISITYSVQYDDLEVEQLSPGTRGIVLLLLDLAIDQDDDRPLVIDQPEENLDPKSIFVELVDLSLPKNRFSEARASTLDHVTISRDDRVPEIARRSGIIFL